MSDKNYRHIKTLNFEKILDDTDQPNQKYGTMQSCDSHNVKKRKVSTLNQKARKVIRGAPRSLALPQISTSNDDGCSLIVRYESPWDTYRKALFCNIAGHVIIAAHRFRPSRVIAVREYCKNDVEKMLERYRSLKHSNILSAGECFIEDESMFALVDDLPVTLAHLVGCRTLYPTEIELASIAWQVLDGACYLSTLGLEHQSLTCRNVLLGLDGIVKIACIESCVERNPNQAQSSYIKALSSITMEVMQKYDKDCGIVGIDNLQRWPVDSEAFQFLSAISTTKTIEALKEQPLVSRKHRLKGELVLLVRSVLLSADIFYSLEE